MGEFLWTQHIRDDCPLEPLLRDRARAARANANAVRLGRVQGRTTDALVAELSTTWSELAAPLAVNGKPMAAGEPDSIDRHDHKSARRYRYWRWVYRVPVSGDIELLERWPDQLDRSPLGEHQFEPPSGPLLRSGDGCVLIFADVPCDEDPEGSTPPGDQVTAAADYLADALAAVNAQLVEYDRGLRAELVETVQTRLQRLARIAEGNTEIIELAYDRLGPLQVDAADGAPTAEVFVAGPESKSDEPVAVAVDLNFVLRDGSVADLHNVIGKWRVGVERYPATYAKLEEEDISSLLVTTLNTVFDSAHREVFQSAGKTDIFVQAETRSYEKAAHVAEAKIWGGKSAVPTDLGQLLGYGTASTPTQLLLYYVRSEKLPLVVKRCKQAVLPSSADGNLEELGPFDFATNVNHPAFGTTVRVTVMFVHVFQRGAVDPDEPEANPEQ